MRPDKEQGIYITQEDIDVALGAAQQSEEDVVPLFLSESDIVESNFDIELEEDEYFGLLSKDDIEALLQGSSDLAESQSAQDEIDSLIQGSTLQEATSAGVEKKSENEIKATQEDIDSLIQDTRPRTETETERQPEATSPTETVSVTQEDIERLLTEATDGAETEAETLTGSDTEDGPVEQGTEGAVSQDDIDRLLASSLEEDGSDIEIDFGQSTSAEPESIPESLNGPESLISQSDLDQLMGEGQSTDLVEADAPEDTSPSSDHITQDDINRLLKESQDEEESPDVEKETLPGEEEILPDEGGTDTADEVELQEPVILAAVEEQAEPVSASKPQPVQKIKRTGHGRWKKRIAKKHLLWAMAAGVVLLMSVSIVKKMSSGQKETSPRPEVLTFSVNQTAQEASNATMVSANSIRLPGFVVLAPPNSAAVAYLTADLTLDFSDASIVAVIKENEAFVRDIIYGTIRNELTTRGIANIDEISLELAIRKALGQVVARETIERIAFDRFSLV